jgi:hypothetical protein
VTTVDPNRRWCAEVTELLRDTALRAARLASAVAVDWLDPEGRRWAERIDALRRAIDEAAQQADDLARRLPDTDPARPELASQLLTALRAASSAGYGPRLGDTAGARVDDTHGVQIAQLPDLPGP